MPKLNKEVPSSLYPRAKSFSELRVERKLRQLARRPRFVAAKIGLWTTFAISAVLVTYRLFTHLPPSNGVDIGGSIFSSSSSILLISAVLALLFYLCLLIRKLAHRALASTRPLYVTVMIGASLTSFILITLTQHQYDNILTLAVILLLNFILIYLAVNFIVKKQNS